jgi:2-polyprenyl-3-methyl-5-hydroxy-6-metoxy-1,4-benzoquinol methylase
VSAPSSRSLRQQHEAEVYDARAGDLAGTLADADLVVDPSQPPYPNREHVAFLDFIFGQLGDPAGKRVLEVGCGSGNLSTYLALRGANAVGVDVSDGMLALARRRAEVNGVSANVELVGMPVEDLDHAAGSYDAVIANQVLHHLELSRAMPNIARLIGTSGVALFAEPVLLLPEWVRGVRYSRAVTRVFPARTDTPDERSIDVRDMASIRAAFATSEVHPFQLTTRLQNFIELSDGAFARMERLDHLLLTRVPGATRLTRYVVFVCRGAAGSQTMERSE